MFLCYTCFLYEFVCVWLELMFNVVCLLVNNWWWSLLLVYIHILAKKKKETTNDDLLRRWLQMVIDSSIYKIYIKFNKLTIPKKSIRAANVVPENNIICNNNRKWICKEMLLEKTTTKKFRITHGFISTLRTSRISNTINKFKPNKTNKKWFAEIKSQQKPEKRWKFIVNDL